MVKNLIIPFSLKRFYQNIIIKEFALKKTNNFGTLKSTRVLFIFIVLQFCMLLHADNASFRTVVSKNDMSVGGDFWLDFQIRITEGTHPRTLNSLTSDVYFGNEISYINADGWAYGSALGYSRFANNLTDYIRVGTTGNSVGQDGPGDPPGWDITSSWQTIVTLKFTITTATSVDISINDATDAAAYFDNYQNNPKGDNTDWTMSNEDTGQVTLPVILSTFTAQFLNNNAELYWVTESEVDNLGWNIYRNFSNNFNTAEKINNEFIAGHGTTTERSHYLYSDIILEPQAGKCFWYWVTSISYSGVMHISAPVSLTIPEVTPQHHEIEIPETFGLFQNSPNPFHPKIEETKIHFLLPSQEKVSLMIFNVKGQLVRNIYEGYLDKGNFIWDGKDKNGEIVSDGIYLLTLFHSNQSEVKRLIIISQ